MTYRIQELDYAHAMQLAVLNQKYMIEQGIESDKNLVQLEMQMKSWLSHDFQAVGSFDSGLLIAFCLFQQSRESIELDRLYVHEDYRKQGVAQTIIQYLSQLLHADTQLKISKNSALGINIYPSSLTRLVSINS
jgi:GNAT superfamily N-acetyltransferase